MQTRTPAIENSANNQTRLNIEPALKKIQAVAGILFSVFLVLHLTNTALAAFGSGVYNQFQQAIQGFYQFPLFELGFVLLPLITHAVVGITLIFLRRAKGRSKAQTKHQLHTWAGFFLLLVVFGHVLATRGLGYFYDAAPGFEGVSFTLWWMPGYFYGYYFLLFMAGYYHSALGIQHIARRFFQTGRKPSLNWRGNLTAAVIAVTALLAFGGVLFEIADPGDNDFARQYAKILDLDLAKLGNR